MPLLSGPITGPKAFAIFASFFVVIIAVNVTLAVQAVAHLPGARGRATPTSPRQLFDRERDAQEALGWTAERPRDPRRRRAWRSGTATGAPWPTPAVSAEIGRPTDRIDDQALALAFDGAAWAAPAALAPGRWQLRLRATAADGTAFRQDLPSAWRRAS